MNTEKKERRSRDFSYMQTRLKDIISECGFYMPTSFEFSDKIQGLKKRFNLPGYWWSWANGYADRVRDEWYQKRHVYCVQFDPSAPLPTVMNWNGLTEAQREILRKPKGDPGYATMLKGFWWKDREGNLTNKIWYASTEAESDALYEEIKARRAETERKTP